MSQSVGHTRPSEPLDAGGRIAGHAPSHGDAFAQARNLMVDGQVRPNQVNDVRINEAMRLIRRERFVPISERLLAYRDGPVPLGRGRELTEPRVVARLIQSARVRAGDKVLVVGAATGYVATLLSWLGGEVVALESDADLAALGETLTSDRDTLAGQRSIVPVTWTIGPLAAGAPDLAPFDVIVIDGAVPLIPASLAQQLRAGGRLVTVIAAAGQVPRASLAEPAGSSLRPVPLFDAMIAPLAELTPASSFTF